MLFIKCSGATPAMRHTFGSPTTFSPCRSQSFGPLMILSWILSAARGIP